MRNHLFIGAAVAALIAPAAVQAQETTSTIRGLVTNAGAPVAGANVTVVHVPSGTRSATTTDANGAFTVPGVRVGGPFTVSVNDNAAQITDIFTNIGTPYDLPIDLADLAGDAQGDIVVTAAAVARAGNISQGPATILTSEDIATVASINRDVRDLSRRDPFARLSDSPGGGRAVSFAGQNARFNRFTVDGVPITDNFGLNPDGLPTRRSPIPFDAIGQYQTRVAPYDVREGNFQGGVINVILKSGTNDFHGTGFYSYNSDKLTGDRTKDRVVNLPKFEDIVYGAQLAGPIIPDRLFFMIAGERVRAGTPIPEGPVDNNAGAPVPGLTQATVDRVRSISQSQYDYEAGGVLSDSQDKDDRLVAKLDANLSDTQRAALTYTYTKDSIRFNQNSFVTPPPGLGLESNGYIASQELHTGVFNLNSDWSDSFSTEVRAFYKDYKRGQDPILGRGFAQFQVCTADQSDRAGGPAGNTLATSCPSGVPQVSLGPDVSRQSNALNSRTFGGLAQARLQAGNHDIRVFTEYANTKIFNLFLQRTAGDFYFDSFADFQAGNAQRLRYQNAIPSLDPNDAAAEFNYKTYTFGAQDSWRLTDTLNIILGVRYDLYGGGSRPALNQDFVNRFGFTNQAYISGRGLFQPRLGFDFKPTDRLSFRGGAGLFGGGTPDVYVSNSFSNTGFLSNSIDIRRNNDGSFTVPGVSDPAQAAVIGQAALDGVTGTGISPIVNSYLANRAAATTSPTNALDPDFKVPSQWRATLSADYEADLGPLGDGWRFGADIFYSKVRDQVFFTDIRSVRNGSTTPDGRPRYSPITGSFNDTNSDILLTNTGRGRSYIGVVRFDKTWDLGVNIFGSFTYQDVKDQAPATSSTAGSNYLNGAFVDPNRVAYGISNDEVRYQFKYGFNFARAFFGDYMTRVNLFGESRIGRPFSYTFTDPSGGRSSVFGTIGSGTGGTSGGRYLLYVPTSGGDPRVSFDTPATEAAFNALVDSTGLRKFRGQVAPRNAFNSPWNTKIDLHVEQELPVPFFDQARFTLFGDIENVGNLINSDWGQVREFSFPGTIPAVRVQCLTAPAATGTPGTVAANAGQACAQYRYSNATNTPPQVFSRQSLYAIRVGARFTF